MNDDQRFINARRHLILFSFLVWPFRRFVWKASDWWLKRFVKKSEMTTIEAQERQRLEGVARVLAVAFLFVMLGSFVVIVGSGLSLPENQSHNPLILGLTSVFGPLLHGWFAVHWLAAIYWQLQWEKNGRLPNSPLPSVPVLLVNVIAAQSLFWIAFTASLSTVRVESPVSSTVTVVSALAILGLQAATVVALGESGRKSREEVEETQMGWAT